MSIKNIDFGSEIVSTDHNSNYDFIIAEINTLKSNVTSLETNKATKDEIIRQADLLASNILNDTSGVDGTNLDNALLGLKNLIKNIQNSGANANIGLYNMEDNTNINDYVANEYEVNLFDGFTISLYVANANTGFSTLDVQDGSGTNAIKVIKEDGTKRDVLEGEIFGWNILHFDGTDWILLDKTTYVNNKLGELSALTTTNKDNLVGSINELDSIVSTHDSEITAIESKTDFITITEALDLNLMNSRIGSNEDDILSLESDKADKSTTYTRTEIDGMHDDLAGTGRTTETIKGTYDDLQSHKGDTSNPHSVTASQVGAYSKTEMQTSGSSQVHWNNITDTPNFADNSWKEAVETYDNLPVIGNSLNDMRVVGDDSTSPESLDNGGTAIYVCVATTGTIDEQWDKLADLDWTNDHGGLIGLNDDDHPQYFRHDGTRNMSGNLNMNGNQILNNVLQNATSLPLDIEGLVYYDSNTKEVKVRKNGVTDIISGAGAIIREVEITATSGQTAFDVGQSGVYSYSTNSGVMNVYKKNVDGLYELLDTDDYTETDNTTITLNTGATAGDEYYFKWMKNIATIASAIESNTITNDKLASDIKIGSLSNLNTTDKTSVVNSINETLGNIRTNEQIQDVVDSVIIGGTNISKVYDDINNTLTLNLNISDTEVLNKIKNVDGIGSGLDADLLDGQQASAFQPAGTYNTTIGTNNNLVTSGATVVDDINMTDGVVTSHTTRTLTLADLGYTGSTTANDYSHPTYNGDDFSVDSGSLSGASVINDIDINVTTDSLGHVVDANGVISARELTPADIGALATTGKAVDSVKWDGYNLPTRSNWSTNNGDNIVVGQLAWQNYNNNHTIFDASSGLTPTGVVCDKSNPDVSWSSSYPTLMGYNGSSTYGVRVDKARDADTVDGEHASAFANASHNHDVSNITGLIESTSFSGTYPVVFHIGGTRLFTNSATYTGSTNTLYSPNIDAGDYYTDGVRQPKTTVATTAPSSPSTNDIWIDTSG